jgi:F1F0 ATPase subunit 2
MSEPLMLALDLAVGLVLGTIFYGGLWSTVRRISARAAGLWLAGSFLVRASIVLAGFYAVARSSWYGPAPCLVGFFVARIAVTRFTRVRPTSGRPLAAGTAP